MNLSELYSKEVIEQASQIDINKTFDEFDLQSALCSKIIRAMIKNEIADKKTIPIRKER